MTVNAITDTKKERTGIAPTYLHTTRLRPCAVLWPCTFCSDRFIRAFFACFDPKKNLKGTLQPKFKGGGV